ncbi:hypothetical protein [Rothia mucilaginosa]|uniref:hypothetical protein n=1 Tax=Rothia mucilaginosa TaxID=43675 RepID=UPI0028D288A0|nr:hypothetical protein [Rothia mucilaginosa]
MSTTISRRKVVAGAAWAAPVVAASAAVPAFASSTECEWASSPAYTAQGTSAGAKNTVSFVVPTKVDKIKFEVVSGAGGTNYEDILAGSGAKITGTIAVQPGQTVQLIGAAGGIGNGPLSPAEGGEGYGNGGSSNLPNPIPSSIMQQVNTIWPPNSPNKRITYSASGGGSSALVINGTPVAVAGGGGGAGFINSGGANNPKGLVQPGAVDAGYQWPEGAKRNASPVIGSTGGSAEAGAGSAGNSGSLIRTADTTQMTVVEAGKGGAGGVGGNGGSKTALPTGKSTNGVIGYYSTNNQEIFQSSNSGNNGGAGFNGAGGDGVGSYSYMIDNNPKSLTEPAQGQVNGLAYESHAFNFNGYESVISAGGGAGYGGGGSGASTSSMGIVLTQKWNNNPKGIRQNTDFGQLGGGGGAGGSYIAPGVSGGNITSAGNAPTARSTRGNGYVKVTLCQRS